MDLKLTTEFLIEEKEGEVKKIVRELIMPKEYKNRISTVKAEVLR